MYLIEICTRSPKTCTTMLTGSKKTGTIGIPTSTRMDNCCMFTQINTISHEDKLIVAAPNNMEESHRCNGHRKKPYAKEFIMSESIYPNTKRNHRI